MTIATTYVAHTRLYQYGYDTVTRDKFLKNTHDIYG